MSMRPFKNRHVQISFPKGEEQPEFAQQKLEAMNHAEDIQETIRIISTHVIIGVGTYVFLDTFRKVVVKMVPGH